MYRKTYVEINENNLKSNIENIRKNYPDYKYYFGVVKGNAYSHGMHIVSSLIDGGINYLAVSSLEEALEIRKYNKDIPILCFGYINIKDINIAINNNITISIISYDYFKQLIKENIKNLKVHIKINTGMNRLGLNTKEEVKEVVDTLEKSDINLEGVYTHYATTGVLDTIWDKQTKKFLELTSLIDLNKIEIVHAYDSVALVKHKKLDYLNGVRLGIVMYGYSSSSKQLSRIKKIIFNLKKFIKTKGKKISDTTLNNHLNLKKAFDLYSEVVNIANVKKGESVGYHGMYICTKDSIVATIPIGYADGITKYYKYVKINNKKYLIIAICMDAIMVLVDESVKNNDKVTIIDEELNISSIALNSGRNVNEELVSITNRIPRVHIYNDNKTEIKY